MSYRSSFINISSLLIIIKSISQSKQFFSDSNRYRFLSSSHCHVINKKQFFFFNDSIKKYCERGKLRVWNKNRERVSLCTLDSRTKLLPFITVYPELFKWGWRLCETDCSMSPSISRSTRGKQTFCFFHWWWWLTPSSFN